MSVTREQAAKRIALFLKPADVINSTWSLTRSILSFDAFNPKHALRNIARVGIQGFQRSHFGELGNTKDVHTRINLNDVDGRSQTFNIFNRSIFEFTVPKSQFVSLFDIAMDQISILRFRPYRYTAADLAFMLEKARELEGKEYDYGNLIGFLIHKTAGYGPDTKPILDLGETRHVCSTAVRAILEGCRKWHEDVVGDLACIPRMFNVADPTIWKAAGKLANVEASLVYPKPAIKVVDDAAGLPEIKTAIEYTMPATFRCSHYFSGEFEMIAEFRDGERIN